MHYQRVFLNDHNDKSFDHAHQSFSTMGIAFEFSIPFENLVLTSLEFHSKLMHLS